MLLEVNGARRLALLNGLGRSALGVVAFVAPVLPLTPWVGPTATDPTAKLLARALGGRDLAIGLGTLWAMRRRQPLAVWVAAAGLADAGDVAVTLARFSSLPRIGRWVVLAAAAGGAAAAAVSAGAVDA